MHVNHFIVEKNIEEKVNSLVRRNVEKQWAEKGLMCLKVWSFSMFIWYERSFQKRWYVSTRVYGRPWPLNWE
jgi:hypothetical protein